MMMEAVDPGLMLGEMALYFVVMLGLFRVRHFLGIGTFFCALGSFHFLETYLAANFYIELPIGGALSPGSVVLFAGKLVLLLLVYIREDAAVARQGIYGLLIGDLIGFLFVGILRLHPIVAGPHAAADFVFLREMGWLSLWGTALLVIDAIMMILLYERIGSWRLRLGARLGLTIAAVLTLDQAGFFAALHFGFGVPWEAFIGGWIGKMAAAVVYAAMGAAYLTWIERDGQALRSGVRPIGDVFDVLTYRERYEALRREVDRDTLTGVLDRRQFAPLGSDLLAVSRRTGQPFALLLIDLDHFKEVNDRYGHPAGDAVLKRIANALSAELRSSDFIVRYGGEEFAVFAPGADGGRAGAIADGLRRRIETLPLGELRLGGVQFGGIGAGGAGAGDGKAGAAPLRLTISVGIASATEDGDTLPQLLAVADRRLYEAKARGRNTIVGGEG